MSRPPFLDLPESSRAYRLETARGSFAVLDAAPPKPPRGTALLVPGFTGSKEDFIALLDPLARAGWRVVAVDGRGQYESGGPRTEAAYRLSELAADLTAQAQALSGPVHLVGHSLGGLVARCAVLDGGGPWASLTLMSSGAGAIDAGQQVRTKMLIDALGTMDMESVWRAMRAMDGEDPVDVTDAQDYGRAPAEVDEFLHQRWLATVPQQLIATARQLMDEPDRVGELATVPLPKLVVSGEVDYAWPVPELDEMARRLAARREVVAGTGHSPSAEDPAATAGVLSDFWSSLTDR